MKAGSCFSRTFAISDSSTSSLSLSESPAFLFYMCCVWKGRKEEGEEERGSEGGMEGGGGGRRRREGIEEGRGPQGKERLLVHMYHTHDSSVYIPVIIVHPKRVLFPL